MRVKYDDGPAAVSIPAAGATAERGKPVAVDPEIGKQLCKQGWKEVKKAAKAEDKE